MEYLKISPLYQQDVDVVLYEGDCLELLDQVPKNSVKLVVTSPPYNLGKPYEKRIELGGYIEQQKEVIRKCVEITHKNLYDDSCEGLRCLDIPAYSVQYHPEAAPGPHDARYLFGQFIQLMEKR